MSNSNLVKIRDPSLPLREMRMFLCFLQLFMLRQVLLINVYWTSFRIKTLELLFTSGVSGKIIRKFIGHAYMSQFYDSIANSMPYSGQKFTIFEN